jgi:hypothetical protein
VQTGGEQGNQFFHVHVLSEFLDVTVVHQLGQLRAHGPKGVGASEPFNGNTFGISGHVSVNTSFSIKPSPQTIVRLSGEP